MSLKGILIRDNMRLFGQTRLAKKLIESSLLYKRSDNCIFYRHRWVPCKHMLLQICTYTIHVCYDRNKSYYTIWQKIAD